MNLIRTACTVLCGAILGSLLAVTASAQALPQEEEPKPRREATPPPETRPETAPDSPTKQENAKPEKPEKQNDKESQKEAKPSSESSKSEASGQNDRGHARPAGKSARIPDDKFRASFGREHKFKVSKPVIVDNRPQFQYSGYTFVIVDAWPVGWAYTDDCYIDFINGEYFLFDLLHPDVQVALFVQF